MKPAPKSKLKPISRWGLLTALMMVLAGPAVAREALSPQEAPDLFFDSVYKMDYVQAWQVLSHDSQEAILKLIQQTEKDPKLSQAGLRELLENGDRAVQRGFWTQMRQSMDIEAWNKQTFVEPRAGEKSDESFVHVMPADIWLYVHQENQNWKFGFQESFVQKRRPKGVAAPKPQAIPSTAPPGPNKTTGTQN